MQTIILLDGLIFSSFVAIITSQIQIEYNFFNVVSVESDVIMSQYVLQLTGWAHTCKRKD